MSLYDSLKISSQGMSVQRKRMMVVASNLANVSTTRTEEGGPYRRRELIVEAVPRSAFSDTFGAMVEGGDQHDELIQGVRATAIQLDNSPLISKYEPNHPDADGAGYVQYPNINPAVEMTDMVGLSRSYEANLNAVRGARTMIRESIDLLKV